MSDQPAVDDPNLDPRMIAAHLQLDPDHEEVAEIPAWMQHVEVLEFADQVIGTEILVGGYPLFFLPSGDEHVAVLFDRNTGEPLGRELVRFTRNEDGGWFPSVAGLIEIRPGLAVSWPSADGPSEELAVVLIGVTQPARSHAIRAWLERYDGATEAAALVLEPLDPGLTISDGDRAHWRTALRVDAFELQFQMDDADRAALREHCSENRVYRFIRDALADPAGEDGRTLLDELTEADILTARF